MVQPSFRPSAPDCVGIAREKLSPRGLVPPAHRLQPYLQVILAKAARRWAERTCHRTGPRKTGKGHVWGVFQGRESRYTAP